VRKILARSREPHEIRTDIARIVRCWLPLISRSSRA